MALNGDPGGEEAKERSISTMHDGDWVENTLWATEAFRRGSPQEKSERPT